MSFWLFGCERYSFWGRLTEREKVDFRVTFESVGDETSGVFESHFLAFLQCVFPKIILRSVDMPACIPRRELRISGVDESGESSKVWRRAWGDAESCSRLPTP